MQEYFSQNVKYRFCHTSIALNSNFSSVGSFRKTKTYRKYKFQVVWTEIKNDFLRQSFTVCFGTK